MKKIFFLIVISGFLSILGCNTNKPAEEAIDAKDRVKSKVEGIRQDQQEAAEETGVADPAAEEDTASE
jgi:hypothetical protein